VRLADIAFFPNGRAAAVTFDGDVWLVDGLASSSGAVTWRRFASGLHEPLSLCIRKNELLVFDRNGISRLVDSDGHGCADRCGLFSKCLPENAEPSEDDNGMKAAPDV